MPAAIPILIAVTAATATYGAVEQNQQTQHAKGAAQAEATVQQGQVDAATKQTAATQQTQSQTAQVGAAQKMASVLASMSSTGADSGSVTGAANAAPATTASKTLLGT